MDLVALTTFRPMVKTDYNFVLANWAKTYKYSPWAGTVSNTQFHQQMKYTIDCLRFRGMIVQVACADDDEDQLFGFIAYEKSTTGTYVVHYLFVKNDFRKLGLAQALLNHISCSGPYFYTHRTPDSSKFPNAVFAPFLARRKNLEPLRSLDVKAQKRTISPTSPIPERNGQSFNRPNAAEDSAVS